MASTVNSFLTYLRLTVKMFQFYCYRLNFWPFYAYRLTPLSLKVPKFFSGLFAIA